MLSSNKIFVCVCVHENIRNAFLGLVLIVCIIPLLSTNDVSSTTKLTQYVEYKDSEYAENKYLDVGPMRKLKKILYKSVPVNDSSVCNLTDSDLTEICNEIVIYRRSRNSVLNRYEIQEDEEPELCKKYRLKLEWEQEMEKSKVTDVLARKCPTDPPLYISDGKNVGGLFVYALKSPNRKQIKLIDYITFVQRTNYENDK